ncbi:uncharacterized protein PgNI_07130 [Pyricularia grisea]|uniref:FAD/NAD(P)-binding domain-containing protein n=1 Tax=Pyricularia grisea TaxID=148305 RepID=A0A6P8B391_PYRGI|nr:uncharacterized protein PgNI_07130 [Pyricularia grisea]TLD09163.1 hypothetical protein PgNI_07130 [Pyricularia grisea]
MSSTFQLMNSNLDYDVLIVGAGLSGICNLYHLRRLGLRVKVLEAGEGEGGTWHWNRYPGARFDSESLSYTFSFCQEVLDEWSWSEAFAGQPETLRYINFLVDKLDLRRDMQFNTKVESLQFREDSNSWLAKDTQDRQYTARFIVTAVGLLNVPTLPAIPGGIDKFKGLSWHTARWPSEHTLESLRGKRVGVVGVGATGIQTVQALHEVVGSLVVFQREPNWTLPMRNSSISPEEMETLRKQWPDVFKICNDSPASFAHPGNFTTSNDYTEEQLVALWEDTYKKPGFAKVVSVPFDFLMDRAANKKYSDFIAEKIKRRINDPSLAEKMIPKRHGIAGKRVPLETNYYEAFNEPNVRLVDLITRLAIDNNHPPVPSSPHLLGTSSTWLQTTDSTAGWTQAPLDEEPSTAVRRILRAPEGTGSRQSNNPVSRAGHEPGQARFASMPLFSAV